MHGSERRKTFGSGRKLMVKSPMTERQQPFLGEDTKGSAVLSAERTASPLKKQQGGFLRPANFNLSSASKRPYF
jgi:glycyl-tRNA synthetase beta subunit